jgi:hypothetical protein
MIQAVGFPAVEPKNSRGKSYSPKVAKSHSDVAKSNLYDQNNSETQRRKRKPCTKRDHKDSEVPADIHSL